MHSVSPVWRMVVIYYLVCSRLLHCKRIFPNSKEKNIAYLQMSVDQYLINDMRQIVINNIKIHMNVRCAEIANLTMLVEVQMLKLSIKRICKKRSSTIPPRSTKRRITSNLKILNRSKNGWLSLMKQFFFFILYI